MVRRLLHILTARTHTGALYDVDTRLRPSGQAGTMVSSLAAFEQYQQQRCVGVGTPGARARATGRRRSRRQRCVRANPPRRSCVARAIAPSCAARSSTCDAASASRRVASVDLKRDAGRYRGYRVYGPIPRVGRRPPSIHRSPTGPTTSASSRRRRTVGLLEGETAAALKDAYLALRAERHREALGHSRRWPRPRGSRSQRNADPRAVGPPAHAGCCVKE